MAVFEHRLGRIERARRAATAARRLDPTLPEATYDLALVTLEESLAQRDAGARSAAIARAGELLGHALALDAGFVEARSLAANARSLEAGCASDPAALAWERAVPGARRYPVETGQGAPHAASIGRRRHITDLADRLRVAACER